MAIPLTKRVDNFGAEALKTRLAINAIHALLARMSTSLSDSEDSDDFQDQLDELRALVGGGEPTTLDEKKAYVKSVFPGDNVAAMNPQQIDQRLAQAKQQKASQAQPAAAFPPLTALPEWAGN